MWLGKWELVLMLIALGILVLLRIRLGLSRAGKLAEPSTGRGEILQAVAVWIAEGFGTGRFPYGPGTIGSVVGFVWFALLISVGSLSSYFVGLLLGVAASVVFCDAAEKITGRKDPGSVVLDEIAAIPICFIPWLLVEFSRHGSMPSVTAFFGSQTWPMSVVIFALFRLLDIWKPWPIGPSQALPGGWGVTVDDVLAAIGVAILSLGAFI